MKYEPDNPEPPDEQLSPRIDSPAQQAGSGCGGSGGEDSATIGCDIVVRPLSEQTLTQEGKQPTDEEIQKEADYLEQLVGELELGNLLPAEVEFFARLFDSPNTAPHPPTRSTQGHAEESATGKNLVGPAPASAPGGCKAN